MTKQTTTERYFVEAGVIDHFMCLGGYRWKGTPLRKELSAVARDRSLHYGDPSYSAEYPYQRYVEMEDLKLPTFGSSCGDTTFTTLCSVTEAEYEHLKKMGWQPDPSDRGG